MISQTVEYALRAVVHLAAVAPSSCTTSQLAEVTKVPAAYLSKVLQGLSKAGLVRSQRGVGGGISLAATPEEVTILDVVSAVEPMQRIKTCPLEFEQHGTNLCPLHSRLDNAMAELEAVFRNTTLAEILSQEGAPMPLCDRKISYIGREARPLATDEERAKGIEPS
ncbi:MAG: Rrf2 family transcriptional regulator [Planctomycetes bacterium]|nr:Rrf2 family transcriptional regulator [Planctomycetota bacterium]